MLTTHLTSNFYQARTALRGAIIRDMWVSMAALQVSVRKFTSLPNTTNNETNSDFINYRVHKIYSEKTKSHLKKLPAEQQKSMTTALELCPPIKSGLIESVDDLLKVCKTLHALKDIESDSNDALKYKKTGFTLPKHMRYWFRGHADTTYKLIPTLFRNPEFATKEDLMIKEFLLKNPQAAHTDIFYILSKMQHYGYPTRLLDWTSNIMAAAYFTCAELTGEKGKDGMIWILEPYELNLGTKISETLGGMRALQSLAFDFKELRGDYGRDLFRAKHAPEFATSFQAFHSFLEKSLSSHEEKLVKPLAVEPGRINERLAAQSGKFTVSGGKLYSDEHKAETGDKGIYFARPKFLAEGNTPEEVSVSHLSNLVIPKKCKEKIRVDLELILGIDMESFMLDLNSQAEAARRRFGFIR
jgi:hypothetical protein